MFVGTTQEFADRLGVEYLEAAGLLRYLRTAGVAKEAGKRPTKSRPAILFSVPLTFELTIPDAPVDATAKYEPTVEATPEQPEPVAVAVAPKDELTTIEFDAEFADVA